VPVSVVGIVTVKVLEVGVDIISKGLFVKLAFEKVVAPPPAKLGDVNTM
jgi:hypothetical protein